MNLPKSPKRRKNKREDLEVNSIDNIATNEQNCHKIDEKEKEKEKSFSNKDIEVPISPRRRKRKVEEMEVDNINYLATEESCHNKFEEKDKEKDICYSQRGPKSPVSPRRRKRKTEDMEVESLESAGKGVSSLNNKDKSDKKEVKNQIDFNDCNVCGNKGNIYKKISTEDETIIDDETMKKLLRSPKEKLAKRISKNDKNFLVNIPTNLNIDSLTIEDKHINKNKIIKNESKLYYKIRQYTF
jgi:hypothetical protein